MSNDRPNWLNKWGRSPRQDRRVIENGKFVEQGKIHTPEPPAEVPEQEQSALEIVQEPVNVPVQESSIPTSEGQSVSEAMQAELEPIEVVPSAEPSKPNLIDVGEYEESPEPLTPTTEVGGGYVAIEVDRS